MEEEDDTLEEDEEDEEDDTLEEDEEDDTLDEDELELESGLELVLLIEDEEEVIAATLAVGIERIAEEVNEVVNFAVVCAIDVAEVVVEGEAQSERKGKKRHQIDDMLLELAPGQEMCGNDLCYQKCCNGKNEKIGKVNSTVV